MKKILVILLFLTSFLFGKSTFSNPQPSFENPRKVLFQIYDSDLKKINHNLSSIYNILKEYPAESLKIVVVAYGNGMRAFKKDYDKKTLLRITSLVEYDVEFIGCKNTIESMKWKEEEFIDDMEFVQAGIVEVIEKDVAGFTIINAY